MTPDPRSAAVERLAAELASWTGAQGDEGWWDGEVPKGDEPVPADYPDIEEHERRCRAQYALHFDRVHPSAAEKYTTERAAWIARAEKVLRALNLIPAPPDEPLHYYPVDCPICSRRRVMPTDDGPRCEKCGAEVLIAGVSVGLVEAVREAKAALSKHVEEPNRPGLPSRERDNYWRAKLDLADHVLAQLAAGRGGTP
jgi:hypothetical protein